MENEVQSKRVVQFYSAIDRALTCLSDRIWESFEKSLRKNVRPSYEKRAWPFWWYEYIGLNSKCSMKLHKKGALAFHSHFHPLASFFVDPSYAEWVKNTLMGNEGITNTIILNCIVLEKVHIAEQRIHSIRFFLQKKNWNS